MSQDTEPAATLTGEVVSAPSGADGEQFGDVVDATTLAAVSQDAVLVGEPYDGGAVERAGAREGPRAIGPALAALRTHHLDAGPVESVGDLGLVDVSAGESVATVQEQVRAVAAAVHETDAIPVFLGGDGSLTFANVAPLLSRDLLADGGYVPDGGFGEDDDGDVGEVEHFDPTGGGEDEDDESGDEAHADDGEDADTDEEGGEDTEDEGESDDQEGDREKTVSLGEEIVEVEGDDDEQETDETSGEESVEEADESEADDGDDEDEDTNSEDAGEEADDEDEGQDETDAADGEDTTGEAGSEDGSGAAESEDDTPGEVETIEHESTVEPSETVGVVSLDAHLRCRPVEGQPSAATAYRQLFEAGLDALAVVGARHFESATSEAAYLREQGGEIVTAEEVGEDTVTAADCAIDALGDVDTVYVSVDLDVLDATAAPGVSAPTPGGITSRELFRLLRVLASDDRLAGIEVVGAAPPLDSDGRTTQAGARAVAHALAVAGAGPTRT